MNIQALTPQPQYNTLSFDGKKPRLANKDLKSAKKTLKEKIKTKTKNKNEAAPAEHIYDKLLREESILKQIDAEKQKILSFKTYLELILKQKILEQKTCYFMKERAKLEKLESAKAQQIYEEVKKRMIADVDEAILSRKPKEEIDRLFKVTDDFVAKYNHYAI